MWRRLFTALALMISGLFLPCSAEELTSPKQKLPADEFSRLYAELLEGEAKELIPFQRSIEKAIAAAPQVAAYAAKINAAAKAPGKDQKRVQGLREQLLKQFPGAFVLTDKTPIETDPKKIRARLSEVLEGTRHSSIGHCFDVDKRTFSGSEPCHQKLRLSCLELEADGKGNLTAAVVDENLGVKDVRFNSLEELKQSFDYAFVGGTPALCKLASLAGETFKATYPAAYPHFPKGPAGFAMVFPVPDSVRTECFAMDIAAASVAIAKLEGRFPSMGTGFSMPTWKKNLDAREKRCAEAIRELCQNTYLLSGRAILAYPTKGCKVREVTAEDVDSDVKEMAEFGLTQADQLNHAQLKETLSSCQMADSRGFAWRFVQPSTTDCAGKKPEKKSK